MSLYLLDVMNSPVRKLSTRERLRRQRSKQKATASLIRGTTLNTPFKPLTENQLHQIHRAAVELLSQVGMANPTARVLEVAIDSGCVQSDEGRLLFPVSLIEDLIDRAARQFTVHGRSSKFDFHASNDTLNFCTGGAAISMLDLHTQSYRDSKLKDLFDLARLCDILENIQWFTRPIVATDIDDLFELDVNTVYACAAGTQKHIASSFTTGRNLTRIEPLLDHLAGGEGAFRKRPFCTVHATTVVSPLMFAPESLDVACSAIDIGMPIQCQTGPQAGATGPAALAGTVVQGVAESLASLSIINMIRPRHPTILGNWLMVSDLRTGAFSGGGPEQALLGAASGQMATFYGIPGGVGAGMSDSKLPDCQAGFEKALSIAFAALAGGGFVYESAGMLGSLLGCSFESMVIDNELLNYIRRIARGIEVNDQTISVDVITDSVLGSGHFLGHEQTMQLMESEYVYPQYIDRNSHTVWRDQGSTDIWERASKQVKQTLATYYPRYIDRRIDQRMRDQFPIRLSKANMEQP